jgi:hypothetical protein
MRPNQITVPVLTNDLNGICVDQTTSGAEALTLNGALVSGGVATAAAAQIVSIEGTGDNSLVTFTITGTDADGKTLSEDIAGPNNSTVTSTYHYKTVTGISSGAAVTGNVEAGWMATDGMATATIPVDYIQESFSLGLAFNLTAGTMTASAQYSSDDPFDHDRSTTFQQEAYWVEVTNLSGVTADAATSVTFPVRAIRFIQSVGSTTGTNTFTLLQGG